MKKLTYFAFALVGALALVPLKGVTISGTALSGVLNESGSPIGSGWAAFVVFDTEGNGFLLDGGIVVGDTIASGSFFESSDDYIVSFNATTFLNTVPGNASFTLGDNSIDDGDAFGIVFFDSVVSSASVSPEFGDAYGFVTDNSWVAPSNNSDTLTFGGGGTLAQVSGSQANLTVVPEPSSFAFLAGALGFGLALIRRRR